MTEQNDSESRVDHSQYDQPLATAATDGGNSSGNETQPNLAAALERVAEAFRGLMSMGLNERAIVLLIHDAIGQRHGTNAVTKAAIRMVMVAARELPEIFRPEGSLPNTVNKTAILACEPVGVQLPSGNVDIEGAETLARLLAPPKES